MNPATAATMPDEAAGPEAVSRRRMVAWLTWAAPAAAAAALGCTQIGVPMLWRDELATWSATSRTVPQLWMMVHHIDAVLGVYYFGLHLWLAIFGDSATAMRLPSAIAMTVSAAAVALAGRRRGGAAALASLGVVRAGARRRRGGQPGRVVRARGPRGRGARRVLAAHAEQR